MHLSGGNLPHCAFICMNPCVPRINHKRLHSTTMLKFSWNIQGFHPLFKAFNYFTLFSSREIIFLSPYCLKMLGCVIMWNIKYFFFLNLILLTWQNNYWNWFQWSKEPWNTIPSMSLIKKIKPKFGNQQVINCCKKTNKQKTLQILY